MKTTIIAISLLITFSSTAQGPPPPAAMPTDALKPLIDTLIDLSNYDMKFDLLKDSIIGEYQMRYDWNRDKVEEVSSKIKYSHIGYSTLLNAYSGWSEQEVMEVIEFNRKITDSNKSKLNYHPLILYNFKNYIGHVCNNAIGGSASN